MKTLFRVSFSGLLILTTLLCSCVNKKGPDQRPVVSTQPATNVKAFSATVNASVNANSLPSVISFEYGTTKVYGQSVITGEELFDGNEDKSASAEIAGLNSNTEYHFRVKAENSSGTAYGDDLTFTTTDQQPLAVTGLAGSLTGNSVSLTGTVNPNKLSTSVSFEYGVDGTLAYSETALQSPLTGTTDNNVSAKITGLFPVTTYFYRIKAINERGVSYGEILTFKTLKDGQIADFEGNVYNTVTIGTQIWMVENLRTTKLNDGTEISNITSIFDGAWAGLSTPAYCWFNNEIGYKSDYGALYNWYTVGSGRLCPAGWHVATHAEWTNLVAYCGGESIAGNKLKGNTATAKWNPAQNYFDMTNETGFTALPGASRYPEGVFWLNMGYMGCWWTSSESELNNAWMIRMVNKPGTVFIESGNKKYGLSVRCIRD